MKEKNGMFLVVQMFFIVLSLMLQLFKEKFFSYFLFWLFFLGIVFSSFFLMLQKKSTHKFISLIALDIFIFSLFSFNYPLFYQVDRDVSFETQTANLLIAEKSWNPTLGSGYAEDYYGYNPGVHIITAFSSVLSGYTSEFLVKYILILMLGVFFLAAVISVLLAFFKEPYGDVAYIAAFFYVITPRLRILALSRRLVSAIFVLMCLLILIKSLSKKSIKYDVMFMLFSLFVVISDHSVSSFMFMFLFFGILAYLVLFPLLRLFFRFAYRNFGVQFLKYTFLHAISIFIWEILISKKLWDANMNYLNKLFEFISPAAIEEASSDVIRNSPYLYSTLETILIYASQVLIAIIMFFVFLKIAKVFFSKKYQEGYVFDFGFLIYFLLFSFFGYFFSILLSRTEWATLTNVFIWFPLIGICMMLSFIIVSLNLANIKSLLNAKLIFGLIFIAFFFIGSLLINYHPNVLYPKEDTENVMELKQYKNPYIYESGRWLYENSKSDSVIIGDRAVFDIYSGYFQFEQAIIPLTYRLYYSNITTYEMQFLRWPVWTGSYEEKMKQEKLDYIIINEDVFIIKSYLFGDPVPYSYLAKFDASNKTSKIYDNGKIRIYYNSLGNSI